MPVKRHTRVACTTIKAAHIKTSGAHSGKRKKETAAFKFPHAATSIPPEQGPKHQQHRHNTSGTAHTSMQLQPGTGTSPSRPSVSQVVLDYTREAWNNSASGHPDPKGVGNQNNTRKCSGTTPETAIQNTSMYGTHYSPATWNISEDGHPDRGTVRGQMPINPGNFA